MDHITARLECLKLARGSDPSAVVDEDKVLENARKMAEFVIGPKVIESSSQRAKGIDER